MDVGISGIEGGTVAERVRRVEELGFDSVWVSDVLVGDGSPAMEPAVVLAAAAGVSDRLGLGFGVLALPVRPVALVAAQVATLQRLSGDRVLLGVGAGGFAGSPFWEAMGVPAGRRGRLTDAALAVLPRLIAGEPVRLDERAPLRLAPPAVVPPILVGGTSPAAIRRAAKYGDGWFPSLITPERLAEGAARLAELAAGNARPAPRITVGIHYVPGHADSISVTGGPEQVAERLAAYVEAGAHDLVLAPTGPGWKRQVDLLARGAAALRGIFSLGT